VHIVAAMDTSDSSAHQATADLLGQAFVPTLAQQIVGEHLDAFIEHRKSEGRPLRPSEIRVFRRFLECGDVEVGYAGVSCPKCGVLARVPLSCNQRAFCPRCMTRRMMERADYITDRIIGDIPVRHWISTYPPPVRYVLLYRPDVAAEVRTASVKEVLRSYHRRAKKILGLKVRNDAHAGAIVSIQRCSSDLSPNWHLHKLVTDGVFYVGPDGVVIFHELPPPTDEEVAKVAWAICHRTRAILKSYGLWRDVADDTGDANDAPRSRLASPRPIRGVLLRPNKRDRVVTFSARAVGQTHENDGAYSFDLHARRAVAKGDRDGLRQLAQYIHHPPFTDRQLSRLPDNRVGLAPRRPRRDGTLQVVWKVFQLLEKLVHIIPHARSHTTSYHGVYAPKSRLRSKVVPQPNDAEAPCDCGEPPGHKHRHKMTLQDWIARKHGIDLRVCPHCKSRTTSFVKFQRRNFTHRKRSTQDSPDPPFSPGTPMTPGHGAAA